MIEKAFILAGGRGERLRPLTFKIPKVLIEIKGKPVLQWNIELVKKYGVKEIVLAVGYKHEQIEDFFGDGSKFGAKLIYNVEDKFLGTAGALKFAEKHFVNEEKFIAMNGDEIKNIDYAKVSKAHEKNKAIATIALTRVGDVSDWGYVRLSAQKILQFIEKSPKLKGPGLINSGAYLLSPAIFRAIPAGRVVSIEKETFPKLAKLDRLFGCKNIGQWFPVDNFERLEIARREWKALPFSSEK